MVRDDERMDIEFYELCGRVARARGYGDEVCEDFPAWAFERRRLGSRSRVDLLLIDYLRVTFGTRDSPTRELRRSLRDAGAFADEMDETESADLSPEDVLLGEELWMRAEGRERELLRLSFREGFTYGEIAERWGLSEARVCQLLRAALLRLRRILEAC